MNEPFKVLLNFSADNMEVNPEHIVPMDEGEDIPPDQGAAGGPPWGGMGGGFPGFHMQGKRHSRKLCALEVIAKEWNYYCYSILLEFLYHHIYNCIPLR